MAMYRMYLRALTLAGAVFTGGLFGQQVDYRTQSGDILKNGCIWEGRGANVIGGLSNTIFDEWGFDIIRFCIDMNASVHDDAYLQNAVSTARDNDAVIILTAFWYDNQDLGGSTNWKPAQLLASTPQEDERYGLVTQRWKEIANLFKNQPDVWFGVWNEPYWWDGSHGYSEDQWLSDHRALTKNIRDEGAENIIVCQGSHMGQGHDVVINHGGDLVEEFGNIVFDIHMYETRWTLSKQEIKNRIMAVRENVPLMVGEFAIGNHHTRSSNWRDVIDACRETGTSCMYWLYGKEWAERVNYVKSYSRESRNTGCQGSIEPSEPALVAAPQSQSVAEGQRAVFTVEAQGYPLAYQWNRDGEPLEHETGSSLRINAVRSGDDGALFTVTISNDLGSVESEPAELTVMPFEGLRIMRGVPSIDGGFGDWNAAEAIALSHTILGSDRDAADLSASCKLLWDEASLYVMAEVTDDVLYAASETDYENDCVELYIDGTNRKRSSYGPTDRQYRFYAKDESIYEKNGRIGETVCIRQHHHDGYRMEIAIPWAAVGVQPSSGDYIGLDIHVSDNDGEGRDTKLSWAALEDDSWQDPSSFGTAALDEDMLTARDALFTSRGTRTPSDCRIGDNALHILPRGFGPVSVRICTSAGQTVLSRVAPAAGAHISLREFPAGIYAVMVRGARATQRMTLPIVR